MSEIFFEPDQLGDVGALAALGLDRNPVTALVLPRPVAWISSVNADGIANLAPFSFSGMVSQSPPMVMFCANATHVDGGEKDTLKNVRATGEFDFNIATFELRHQMNA
jgi:flavin reductase (DIM6/NTAB) family NADH-FMN oxidoreductase RutF